MGHKVHPKIHRTPFIYAWDSKWYAKKDQYPNVIEQEIKIREFLAKKLKEAGIDAISIERTPKEVMITILAAKPGVVIGRNGEGLEVIRKEIEKKILAFKTKVKLNILAVAQPALSAQIVGQSMASEIERRIPFRRVMKQALEKVMTAGGQGVKFAVAGRLNGVEIARREVMGAGKMSLITLRSDVDYANVEANTIYGKIGIKVWIYKGEAFSRRDKFAKKEVEKEKTK
ncbi:MAG: 30S ribosomal protein S3 [uncultured bacterium]|uniref:Small ribosomal subunit protein uS3 n=1 Tax=Candidatus Magasanikbacteria bacterium RIFOXYD2_FULL_36_9 TaxID=1798707 RepID=A0A1F6P1J1_9BACT|nr:MAG: 30S ribosomal protein S3 [uncultured bacterium]OGH90011.1 MAG: 30S ribosomal protein S3 [Candidatus Magasanikbacteria bacterium RIFOXYD2_FULL_36_9]